MGKSGLWFVLITILLLVNMIEKSYGIDNDQKNNMQISGNGANLGMQTNAMKPSMRLFVVPDKKDTLVVNGHERKLFK